ncbi:MAG: ABC transporter permease subunit [Planctomycetota bacterium]
MLNYFGRRILLVPVTFIAITLMVYAILRVAPGGPIEQLEAQLRGTAAESGAAAAGGPDTQGLDEDAKEELRRYYNLDRPIIVGYLQWLGVWQKTKEKRVPLEERRADEAFWGRADSLLSEYRSAHDAFDATLARVKWTEVGENLFRPVTDAVRQTDTSFFAQADTLLQAGLPKRKELRKHLESAGYQLVDTTYYAPATGTLSAAEQATLAQLVAERQASAASLEELEAWISPRSIGVTSTFSLVHQNRQFSGILQGDFGDSFQYNKSAIDVIVSKFPISIFLGLIGYFSAWFICIPLGVFKAIRHRSHADTITSVAVFIGYATPGWVACLLLLIYFGGGSYFDVVPLGGFRSQDWDLWWENGEYWRCVVDQCHHMAVPVFGYLIASFAAMTILMKNSLLENLGADYVRTAFSKGLPERRVILVHTLRNSMIPITASVGRSLGLVFAGSFLIEKTCNIPGMGLLGFNAILQRDFPIILGTLVFLVLIQLIGNIISDVIWALIDPRIRFQ